VATVTRETDEAVAVTFDVPPDLASEYRYLAGQHVTVRAFIDGEDVRRSYSICAGATTEVLRIGVKRLNGGAFSTWATTELHPGTVLDVMPPVGEFTIDCDSARAVHYGAIAAGSGITPVLSLIATVLETEPASRFTLVLGNRESRTIMFLEELEGWKDRYPDRFHLIHVLSREEQRLPLFSGRIDEARLSILLDAVVDTSSIEQWYLCGPFGLVETARDVLTRRGVPAGCIHDELFFAGPIDEATLPAVLETEEGTVKLTFTLEGRSSVVRLNPETKILDAALRVRRELPFSCRGGMCASCKARVIEGSVEMERNWALVDEDLEKGLILTCQSHPKSDELVITYDV